MNSPSEKYNYKKAAHCCLCGDGFDAKTSEEKLKRDRQHVPSKQFFPKEVRDTANLNLWAAACHKGCNQNSKEFEEYFYHAFWVHVVSANPSFSKVMHRDIARRAAKPQGRAIIKEVLKGAGNVTQGGIVLPPNVIQWKIDIYKTQQVAISTAQALSSYHDNQFLPHGACVDIHLCLEPNELPEYY